MRAAITTLAMFFSAIALGQDQVRYDALIDSAIAYYEEKDYKASAQQFSAAFEELGWKGQPAHRYVAACAWALAGVPDSAIFQLFRIAERANYTDLKRLTTDTALSSLHHHERWERLMALVGANQERIRARINRPLNVFLDSIYTEDQQYRLRIDSVEQRFGRGSSELKALWRMIQERDSSNRAVVSVILDDHGWLGADSIGWTGGEALFLVVQHADIATQEKYLPMMREAVKKGNAHSNSLALLEDRVALRQGRRQIYGSQIGRNAATGEYYVSPLEDAEHVDERRAEVFLQPMSEYVRNWGLVWDAETYVKQLPVLEQNLKTKR